MKHLYLILLFVVVYPGMGQVNADMRAPRQQRVDRMQQRNPANRMPRTGLTLNKIQRAQEVKEVYLTAKLNLTKEQNDRFWPVYRQYQTERFQAELQKRALKMSPPTNSQDQIAQQFAIKQQIVNIDAHYNNEFLKILPADKVLLLYRSEQEFNDEALQSLRSRRQDDVNN